MDADADMSATDAPQTSQKKKKKKKGKDSTDAPRDPLTLELAAVFQALEVGSYMCTASLHDKRLYHVQLTHSKKVVVTTGGGVALPKRSKVSGTGGEDGVPRQGNVLDSSAPSIRRGKERETPKKKRPSALRKVRNLICQALYSMTMDCCCSGDY